MLNHAFSSSGAHTLPTLPVYLVLYLQDNSSYQQNQYHKFKTFQYYYLSLLQILTSIYHLLQIIKRKSRSFVARYQIRAPGLLYSYFLFVF